MIQIASTQSVRVSVLRLRLDRIVVKLGVMYNGWSFTRIRLEKSGFPQT